MTPGYFGDAEATEKHFCVIDGVRYFRTGDIGELVNGQIRIIDRISSVFKLRQGVFVAPAPLEQLYAQSPLVHQILIHGSAEAYAPIAVQFFSQSLLLLCFCLCLLNTTN
jgi:long-subunit acyl-CoA synthetase (AMP-forming)